jgi:hypothetical protein
VKLLAAILLSLQALPAIDLAQARNSKLDAANDCLVAKTDAWLSEYDWHPEEAERWRWATAIIDQCAEEIRASAPPLSDPGSPLRKLADHGALMSGPISNAELRRTEALYYIDGMIRAHFEGKAK